MEGGISKKKKKTLQVEKNIGSQGLDNDRLPLKL